MAAVSNVSSKESGELDLDELARVLSSPGVSRAPSPARPAKRIVADPAAADQFDQSVRSRNAFAGVVALLGLACGICAAELKWASGEEKETVLTLVLKGGASLCSLVLIINALLYYRLQLAALRMPWHVPDSLNWQRYWRIYLFLEIVVLALHPFPAQHGTYDDKYLVLLPLARLYLALRIVRDHSTVYVLRRRLIVMRPSASGTEFSWNFCAKITFFHNKWKSIIALILVNVIMMGYCFHMHERESVEELVGRRGTRKFYDDVWLAVATMSTVGYGDVVPSTQRARIIAGFSAIFGIVLAALLVFVVMEALAFSQVDQEMRRLLRAHRLEEMVRENAARFIQSSWRLFLRLRTVERTPSTLEMQARTSSDSSKGATRRRGGPGSDAGAASSAQSSPSFAALPNLLRKGNKPRSLRDSEDFWRAAALYRAQVLNMRREREELAAEARLSGAAASNAHPSLGLHSGVFSGPQVPALLMRPHPGDASSHSRAAAATLSETLAAMPAAADMSPEMRSMYDVVVRNQLVNSEAQRRHAELLEVINRRMDRLEKLIESHALIG